jgi:uncharacterized protein YuzE
MVTPRLSAAILGSCYCPTAKQCTTRLLTKTSRHEDTTTDSLYIEVRSLPSRRTVEIEPDIMLDLGEDGKPVGYDIQHASTKTEFIARLILEDQAAAE